MLTVDPQSPFADYGVDKYDIGAGFGHFGVGVDDVRLQIWTLPSIAQIKMLNQLEPCLEIRTLMAE
jgi:hypothetical protein